MLHSWTGDSPSAFSTSRRLRREPRPRHARIRSAVASCTSGNGALSSITGQSIQPTPLERVAPERAAQDAPRYAAFFEEIGETWGDIPDYAALVAHFGAVGLRRQRRAVRWLAGEDLVSIDAQAREDDSGRRRIDASMNNLPTGSKAREILTDYHVELDERVRRGALARRSMRLGLAPAGPGHEQRHRGCSFGFVRCIGWSTVRVAPRALVALSRNVPRHWLVR